MFLTPVILFKTLSPSAALPPLGLSMKLQTLKACKGWNPRSLLCITVEARLRINGRALARALLPSVRFVNEAAVFIGEAEEIIERVGEAEKTIGKVGEVEKTIERVGWLHVFECTFSLLWMLSNSGHFPHEFSSEEAEVKTGSQISAFELWQHVPEVYGELSETLSIQLAPAFWSTTGFVHCSRYVIALEDLRENVGGNQGLELVLARILDHCGAF
ncbi:hypothetical protein C8R42DRAFT_648511 [Lentinula raphanica]|nr:hypothetical protein C8R42DRAFT_648511 [Lentinula raphanica]